MRFAFASDEQSTFAAALVRDIRLLLEQRGHEVLPDGDPTTIPADVDVVFNVTRAEEPRANYLRSSPATFVCTIAEAHPVDGEAQQAAYRVLVRTMSNLLVYVVPTGEPAASWLVTPELGFRRVLHDAEHVATVVDKVLAISDVTFVIDNELVPDLPPELADGDGRTRALQRVGRQLEGLGLLPSVLPLEEILSKQERRLLMKVFGVKQLSYGNLSTRRDAETFWMTGRGVNKGDLQQVGRDLLLVPGLDEEAGRVRVRVPPGTDDSVRVSVDAVEHALLYQAFPGIGAIIHVHAWMPGIRSTSQNYPCGTVDLAREVLALVQQEPEPERCVVGLRNHGITATGPDLDSLFERLSGRLQRSVPMD